MTDATVTIQGHTTAAPELRFTQNGKPVANFNVAHTPRRRNPETGEFEDAGDTVFLTVTVWGDQATYVADSLTKGTAVVVIGRLTSRTYQHSDGSNRTVLECTADVVSVDLRRARATVNRVTAAPAEAPSGDSWAAPTRAAAKAA